MSGHDQVFPRNISLDDPGLTKREYFAAKAMQGLLSNSACISDFNSLAIDAVNLADTCIRALNTL